MQDISTIKMKSKIVFIKIVEHNKTLKCQITTKLNLLYKKNSKNKITTILFDILIILQYQTLKINLHLDTNISITIKILHGHKHSQIQMIQSMIA